MFGLHYKNAKKNNNQRRNSGGRFCTIDKNEVVISVGTETVPSTGDNKKQTNEVVVSAGTETVPSTNDNNKPTNDENNKQKNEVVFSTGTNKRLFSSTGTNKRFSVREVEFLTTKDGRGGRRISMSDLSDKNSTKEWKLASCVPTFCQECTSRCTRNSRCTSNGFPSSSTSTSDFDDDLDEDSDISSIDSDSSKKTIYSDDSSVDESVTLETETNDSAQLTELDKNILVNYHDLKHCIETNLCCKFCSQKGRVKGKTLSIDERTIGIATTLTIYCNSCSKIHTVIPAKKKTGQFQTPTLKHFAIHYGVILCSMTNGFGLSAMGNIFASLGLKCSSLIGRVHRAQWRDLEKDIGNIVRSVTRNIVDKNLEKEIEETIREIESQVDPAEKTVVDPDYIVPLTVSTDAGWQKRSSGNRYDSLSCHCMMIGQRTQKVIDYEVFCKQCIVCKRSNQESEKKEKTNDDKKVNVVNETILDRNKIKHLQEVEDVILLQQPNSNDESQNLLEPDENVQHLPVVIETQLTNVSDLKSDDDDSLKDCANNQEINNLLHNNTISSNQMTNEYLVPSNTVIEKKPSNTVIEKRRNKLPSYLDADYKLKEITSWEPSHPGCCRNFEGTSKSMEVVGNTLLVCRIYNHQGKRRAYVHALVTDDDTTTRSAMRHSFNDKLFVGEWKIENKKHDWPKNASGKYLPDYGRIPLNVKPPEDFLADPSHRRKVFAGQLFKLAADNSNTIQKHDAELLKIYFGYAQAQYNGEDEESFGKRFRACLDHLHNVHDNCDSKWCKFKDDPEKIKTEGAVKFYKYGTEDYYKLKEVFDHYTSPNMLRMINHKWSTQKNESLNRCIAKCAPKHLHYSNSMNLNSRIAFAVGSNSEGYIEFVAMLYKQFDMKINNVSLMAWKAMEKDRLYFKEYKSRKTTKARRIRVFREKLRKLLEDTRIARKHSLDYESGVAVKMKRQKVIQCPKCKQTSHGSSKHPDCPFFTQKKK